jgi:hypothetical protein
MLDSSSGSKGPLLTSKLQEFVMAQQQPSMQKLKKIQERQAKEPFKPKAQPSSVSAESAGKLNNQKPAMWYSPDGTDIRVCLPDGRCAIVGEVPRDLPRSYWRQAGRDGCLATTQIKPADFNIPTAADHEDPEKRSNAIRELVLSAATAGEDDVAFEGAFTPAGIPNVMWLSQRLGFLVHREERDAAWNQIKSEVEQNEESEEEKDDA